MQQPPIIPLVTKINRLASIADQPPFPVSAITSAGLNTFQTTTPTNLKVGDDVWGLGYVGGSTQIATVVDSTHYTTAGANSLSGTESFLIVPQSGVGSVIYKLRLGAVNRSLNDAVTLAQVEAEEATFDGYPTGGIAVEWTPGYIAPGNVPSNESQLAVFIMNLNPPVTANTIYYWWIDDGTNVIMCQSFENPIGMANFGNAIKMLVEDSYPPGLPAVQVVP